MGTLFDPSAVGTLRVIRKHNLHLPTQVLTNSRLSRVIELGMHGRLRDADTSPDQLRLIADIHPKEGILSSTPAILNTTSRARTLRNTTPSTQRREEERLTDDSKRRITSLVPVVKSSIYARKVEQPQRIFITKDLANSSGHLEQLFTLA